MSAGFCILAQACRAARVWMVKAGVHLKNDHVLSHAKRHLQKGPFLQILRQVTGETL
ncbi:hypothetical protein ASD8599_01964 [Ascidiaceihabitans donghaensis]|uniref:Uncharacterized protein n=1 Tax=Ascidiaceihabitans donghaensis TaxID=1510460 RepID=A0A2R8BDR9_9RHOB|nr:hypothetical protein ASD8599_01964 [Ascidiaceihabitans donghaensis]